jgi:DNA-binding SARP family transcriptional activator/TolB-like protein
LLRLKALGGLAVISDDGKPVVAATQRRRLALLAVVAESGNKGVSRDRLLTLLWPDHDEPKGRHGLAQTLYALKRDLGVDSLFLGTSVLRLNGEVIASDIEDFRNAIAAGELAKAVDMYQGPLLDGVYLSGAPDFERWVDSQRQIFASAFASACEALSGQLMHGDHGAASAILSRLAAIDPLNKRVVLKAMRALVAAGDVSGALNHADRHESHRLEELEMPADSDVVALRNEIRANERRVLAPPTADIVLQAVAEVVDAERGDEGVSPAPPQRLHFRRRAAEYWIGAVAAIAIFVSFFAGGVLPAGAKNRSETRIAILPFVVRGNPRMAYLGEGIVDLLSHRLDGTGAIHTVDPNALLEFVGTDLDMNAELARGRATAQHFGAGQFVIGSIVDAGGIIQISATVYDAEGTRVAVADASAADEAHVLSLVDDIARGLVGVELSEPDAHLGKEAAQTTASLPALKAFLQGEEEFRAARMQAAVDSYLKAVAADSTFALAWYRLSTAADWASQSDIVTKATRSAVRFESRLSAEERMLLDARMAALRGDDDKVENLYRFILASHPEDGEAWMQLGETVFHNGGWRGKSIQESRAAFERAAKLRSSHVASLLHLARLAALRNDRPALDTLISAAATHSKDPSQLLELAGLDALTTNKARAETFLDSLEHVSANEAGSAESIRLAVWRLATFATDPESARRLALTLTKAGHPPSTRLSGFLAAAHMSAARGIWPLSNSLLVRADAINHPAATRTRANIISSGLFAVLPTELRAARTALRSLRESQRDGATTIADASLVGRLSAALHDSAAVRWSLEEITNATRGDSSLALIAAHLRQQIVARERYFSGDKSGALAAIESGWPDHNPQSAYPLLQSEMYTNASGRFARARMLDEAGRYAEALPWYETIAEDQGYGTIYLAPSYLRRAVIEERLGRTAAAIDHYQRFISLWQNADLPLQPQVRFAKNRLSRISRTG